MAQVFITFAPEDRAWVRQLADAIAKAGFGVFWDVTPGLGQAVTHDVETEVAKAGAVIAVWSTASRASNWVRDVAQEAHERSLLLPVLKDVERPPLGFRQLRCADLRGWPEQPDKADALAELLSQLRERVSPSAPPPPDSDLDFERSTIILKDRSQDSSRSFATPSGAVIPTGTSLASGDGGLSRSIPRVAARMASPGDLRPGDEIGQYKVVRRLGAGGFGAVYEAANIHNEDERVALKLLLADVAASERFAQLLKLEANALLRLKHPAVVQYRVFGRIADSEQFYLVTEFIPGPTLREWRRANVATLKDVRTLGVRLAQGLSAAHRRGIVHRDLAPDNVIVAGDEIGEATLIDFGIARMGDSDTLGGAFAGKFSYAAPEQFEFDAGRLGPSIDIYSFGLLLAAFARGRPLDMGRDLDAARERRKAVPPLDGIPASLLPPLTALLQPNPLDRPRNMDEVVRLFEGLPEIEPLPAPEAVTVVVAPEAPAIAPNAPQAPIVDAGHALPVESRAVESEPLPAPDVPETESPDVEAQGDESAVPGAAEPDTNDREHDIVEAPPLPPPSSRPVADAPLSDKPPPDEPLADSAGKPIDDERPDDKLIKEDHAAANEASALDRRKRKSGGRTIGAFLAIALVGAGLTYMIWPKDKAADGPVAGQSPPPVPEPEPSPKPPVSEPEPTPQPPISEPEPTPQPPVPEPEPTPPTPISEPEPTPQPPVSEPEPTPQPPVSEPEPTPQPPVSEPEPTPQPPVSEPEPTPQPPVSEPEPTPQPPVSEPEPTPQPPVSEPEPPPPPPVSEPEPSADPMPDPPVPVPKPEPQAATPQPPTPEPQAEPAPAAPLASGAIEKAPRGTKVQKQAGKAYGGENKTARIVYVARRAVTLKVVAGGTIAIDRTLAKGDSYRLADRRDLAVSASDAGALDVILDGAFIGRAGPDGARLENFAVTPVVYGGPDKLPEPQPRPQPAEPQPEPAPPVVANVADEALQSLNAIRKAANLREVKYNGALARVALALAENSAKANDYQVPSSSAVLNLIIQAGYGNARAFQAHAKRQTNVAKVFETWRGRADTAPSLTDPNVAAIGFAGAKAADGTPYWVLILAYPP